MSDLKEDLHDLADRHALQSGGDFDTVLRTATTRRRRRIGALTATACAVVAVGVIAMLSPPQNDGAPALDPKYAGTMTITPSTAKPGAEIELTYPAGYSRGIAFSLAHPDGTGLYTLTAAFRSAPPTWWHVGETGKTALVDVGIQGPGPDRLVVPDAAADGTYLLCTANASVKACALLTVAR
jgi:hypothetical protein